MWLTLVAASLLAVDVDGGINDSGTSALDAGTIYSACPEVEFSDGGSAPEAFAAELHGGVLTPVVPDGGNDWYLPYPRGQRVACKLAACEERVRDLEKYTDTWVPPSWLWITSVVSAAILGAVLVGTVCNKLPFVCGIK